MQTLFTHYQHKTKGLTHLVEQIAQRESLLATLRSSLNPNMHDALIGAEIVDDTLTLLTPSAAWATRLRFDAQKLLAAIHNPNLRHYRIQIMTQSHDIIERSTKYVSEKPSDDALVALQTLTDQLAPNDTLKESMERLLKAVKTG